MSDLSLKKQIIDTYAKLPVKMLRYDILITYIFIAVVNKVLYSFGEAEGSTRKRKYIKTPLLAGLC